MDIIDYLIIHIAPLSLTVKGAGFFLAAMFIMQALGQFLSFRWRKSFFSLLLALITLLLLAHFGADIDIYLNEHQNGPKNMI